MKNKDTFLKRLSVAIQLKTDTMKKTFSFFLATIIFAAFANAQAGFPAAIFQSRNEVTLDAASVLSANYIADITPLAFTLSEEANAFFLNKTDNLVSYVVDFPANQVTIRLNIPFANSSWGIAEWNQYLNQKLQ